MKKIFFISALALTILTMGGCKKEKDNIFEEWANIHQGEIIKGLKCSKEITKKEAVFNIQGKWKLMVSVNNKNEVLQDYSCNQIFFEIDTISSQITINSDLKIQKTGVYSFQNNSNWELYLPINAISMQISFSIKDKKNNLTYTVIGSITKYTLTLYEEYDMPNHQFLLLEPKVKKIFLRY